MATRTRKTAAVVAIVATVDAPAVAVIQHTDVLPNVAAALAAPEVSPAEREAIAAAAAFVDAKKNEYGSRFRLCRAVAALFPDSVGIDTSDRKVRAVFAAKLVDLLGKDFDKTERSTLAYGAALLANGDASADWSALALAIAAARKVGKGENNTGAGGAGGAGETGDDAGDSDGAELVTVTAHVGPDALRGTIAAFLRGGNYKTLADAEGAAHKMLREEVARFAAELAAAVKIAA